MRAVEGCRAVGADEAWGERERSESVTRLLLSFTGVPVWSLMRTNRRLPRGHTDLEELRADQGTFTLRLSTWLLRPAHTWGLLIGVLGLPLILLVYVKSLTEGSPDSPGFWSELWTELMKNPGDRAILWLGAALLPLAVVFFVLQSRAYLRVTSLGLEGYIPRWLGIGMFRQTLGRWSMNWDEVRRARLVLPPESAGKPARLGVSRLVIETPEREAWVAAFNWYDADGPDHRLGLGEIVAFRRLDVVRRLQSAPLVRAVKARNLEIDIEAGTTAPPVAGFDLTQHKGLLTQVCVFLGVGVYAVVDTFFIRSWLPLGPLPMTPFVAAAALAAIAAWKLGHGSPTLERVAVGALTVAACVAAAYPATLRLNATTAEAEVVTYLSAGAGRFEAPDERLPSIDLSGQDVPEYWALYPHGAEHPFTLLRGDAGFYQLEIAPFHERTRQFYLERRNGG